MHFQCMSLSYKNADVALREKVAFSGHESTRFTIDLISVDGVSEALTLITCNRTEIYVVCEPDCDLDIAASLAKYKGLDVQAISDAAQNFSDAKAVEHLFGLVCGLNSMVVGEPEILGQVKKAYANALAGDSTGKVLNSTFQKAFSLAKQVRNGTAIGNYRVSVASVAADEIARRIDVSNSNIAVWGTGPVGRAVVRTLLKYGLCQGTIIGRDSFKTRNLASEFGGFAMSAEKLKSVIAECDVFVSCTGSAHFVIDEDALSERVSDKSLLLVDLAVPRDIDPAVSSHPNLDLLDMDGIGELSRQGIQARLDVRDQLLPRISEEAQKLWSCLSATVSQCCLADWRIGAHDALADEMARLYSELPEISPEIKEKVDVFGHRLLHRMLHWPTSAISKALREGLPCADIFSGDEEDQK